MGGVCWLSIRPYICLSIYIYITILAFAHIMDQVALSSLPPVLFWAEELLSRGAGSNERFSSLPFVREA